MPDAMLEARSKRRHQLRSGGYCPIPLYGKEPPDYGKNNKRGGLKEWPKLTNITREMIGMWARTWPDAINTGVLTHNMPTLDIDILDQDAAVAIEDLVRERFEERGWFLVRIGQPPKRAIIFRTISPFRKLTSNLTAPNGSAEKLEFLCDGQQLVVDGIHPAAGQPYRWFGGEPWRIRRDELPYIHEHEARALIDDAATLLCREFGYQRASPPRSIANGRGGAAGYANPGGEERWHELIDNILRGRALHDSFRDLAAMLAASGMGSGHAKHLLCALGEAIEPYDARVEARLRDISRAVDSAYSKWGPRP